MVNSVLTPEQAARLTGIIEDARPWVPCKYRGCLDRGTFYMRRQLRKGMEQHGMYCDEHDQQFGEENLNRWAHEVKGSVETIRDPYGEYRAVVIPNDYLSVGG